jgi:dipeptidase E
MKKLFLSSSFSDVAALLPDFAGADLRGKTVTFIPTASIPESVTFYVKAGRKALERLGLSVEVLELTKESPETIEGILKKNDLIYVSGGNTFFLLQELRKSGADRIIAELVGRGKMYVGESAGSMVVAPDVEYASRMDDVKKAPDLSDYTALGLVHCYPLPHYTNFPFAKKVDAIMKTHGGEIRLIPITNSQVILVDNDDTIVQSV